MEQTKLKIRYVVETELATSESMKELKEWEKLLFSQAKLIDRQVEICVPQRG